MCVRTLLASFNLCAGLLASFAVAITCGAATGAEPESPGDTAVKLVEALASPNKPLGLDGKYDFGDIFTLSPPYDLKAQDRVNSAWHKLMEMQSEAFPAVIAKLSDKRYCTTACPFAGFVDFSVGDICRKILSSQLEFYVRINGYRDHAETPNPSYLRAHFADAKMASKWATSHRGKPLWEIQIEVLEWLVSKKKESDTDIYDQAELVGPLVYLADHLRRTKTRGAALQTVLLCSGVRPKTSAEVQTK